MSVDALISRSTCDVDLNKARLTKDCLFRRVNQTLVRKIQTCEMHILSISRVAGKNWAPSSGFFFVAIFQYLASAFFLLIQILKLLPLYHQLLQQRGG